MNLRFAAVFFLAAATGLACSRSTEPLEAAGDRIRGSGPAPTPAPMMEEPGADTVRQAAEPASAPAPVSTRRRLVRAQPSDASGAFRPGTSPPVEGVAVQLDREAYDRIRDNPFRRVSDAPLSTFSVNVDTASYANVLRILGEGRDLPPDAVRIEEFVNAFDYGYAPPASDADAPLAARLAVADCPWTPGHMLVRIALKGREVAAADRPAANLVFLLDTSGSMSAPTSSRS